MRLIAALMACTAIALLPACGAEDLDPAAVADAAEKTTAAGGSRVQSRIEMTLPDVGDELGEPADWRG